MIPMNRILSEGHSSAPWPRPPSSTLGKEAGVRALYFSKALRLSAIFARCASRSAFASA